jgi:hypothetical protein
MTDQQYYGLSQYQSCCELLDVDPVHNGTKPTLLDVSRNLLAQHNELKAKHQLLLQKTDAALLAAVQQGIASTPERILTPEVLGAIRLPVQASKFSVFARAFPRDSRCNQRGEWLLITQP